MRPFRSIAIDAPPGQGKHAGQGTGGPSGLFVCGYRRHLPDGGAVCGPTGRGLRGPTAGAAPAAGASTLPDLWSRRPSAHAAGGEDVTQAIRENQVSRYASQVSAYPAVRAFLLEMQRTWPEPMMSSWMAGTSGTVVPAPGGPENFSHRFRGRSGPAAAAGSCRPAGPRWTWRPSRRRSPSGTLRDSHRSAAPLRKAADAVVVDTSQMDRGGEPCGPDYPGEREVRPVTLYEFAYIVSKMIFSIVTFRTPLKAYGKENIPAGGAVICSNHVHNSDPFTSSTLSPKGQDMDYGQGGDPSLPRGGAAAQLAGLCHLGPAGEVGCGGHQVCPESPQGGRRSSLIFPSRVPAMRRSGEGKTGAAMMAIRTGVPVLPVYIAPERTPVPPDQGVHWGALSASLQRTAGPQRRTMRR